MRAYKVVATLAVDVPHAPPPVVRLAGSDAEARAMRRALMEAHGLKMVDVAYDQVEVPTDKHGLIAYVNGLLGGDA